MIKSSIPGRSSGRIFFSRVSFYADSYFGIRSRSLTQSLDFCSHWGDLRAEEADIYLQTVLLVAIDRRFGNPKVISIQSLMLSDQLFRHLPHLHPPLTVPCMMVLERVSGLMTWPNHASFHCLVVARRGSWGPMRLLTRLHSQLSRVLCTRCGELSSGFWS